MSKFAVTFEGQLMDPHMTKLGLAEGVEYESSSTLMGSESGGIGAQRHTVITEGPSAKAASDAVMDALGADAGKFHDWEIETIS